MKYPIAVNAANPERPNAAAVCLILALAIRHIPYKDILRCGYVTYIFKKNL